MDGMAHKVCSYKWIYKMFVIVVDMVRFSLTDPSTTGFFLGMFLVPELLI